MRRNNYRACTNTFADIDLYYKDNIREGWFWKAQRFKTYLNNFCIRQHEMDGYEDQFPITSINRRTVFEKDHEDAEVRGGGRTTIRQCIEMLLLARGDGA